MNKYTPLITVIIIFLVSSCSSDGRYQQHKDSIPTRTPTPSELKDPTPRFESPSRGGNKPYQVWGKDYNVLGSADNYEQKGIASWYGEKFHGHLTSNGEIYDMYAMSAAHKSLPLPTYVRVTNLANNKSVIVRVNDRGPFHESRLIDLSYSAAYKLDMLKSGTANVKIKAITDFSPPTTLVTPLKRSIKENSIVSTSNNKKIKLNKAVAVNSKEPRYIQVFATSKPDIAQHTVNNISKTLKKITSKPATYPVSSPVDDKIYKVIIGPIYNHTELNALLLKLKENGYPNAFRKNI
ncbi:MAG: septal ring lytic transglycosylase RlpA family protein [Colwellia sp.]